ncbi:MAG: GIY-YIG nuclease family protein [Clostridia bacterium]|jgi:putative endonuclease
MWYVYILESGKDSKHYIGSTNDLNRRIEEHNNGFVESTSARRPLRIVSYIAVETEEQAHCLEKFLKSGSGFSFIKKRILQFPVLF